MAGAILTLEEVLANPDAALGNAREAAAVVETDLGPMAMRHEAVRSMLREPRMRPSFSSFLQQLGISSGAFYDWMSGSPLDMEGEEHRRWRQLMIRAFTPASVERLRPFLRAEAQRLVAGFAARGRVEFVEEFARKLPSLGLCELIGVPLEDRARFGAWADTIGFGFNFVLLPVKLAEIDAAIVQLLDYATQLVTSRRAEPRDDLVSRLARAAADDGVDPGMIHGSVAGLVFAGHETTKNQLGWMIAVLSEAPDQWDAVARDPSRAKEVVEEVLRFRSAVTSVARLALEDVDLFGHRIPAGSSLLGSLWSANRDRAEFANPDAFDPASNAEGAQIAFGSGAHHCLGAALARAELQESLIALSARIGCPRLEPGAAFMPAFGISGPSSLPIAFEQRSARSA